MQQIAVAVSAGIPTSHGSQYLLCRPPICMSHGCTNTDMPGQSKEQSYSQMTIVTKYKQLYSKDGKSDNSVTQTPQLVWTGLPKSYY